MLKVIGRVVDCYSPLTQAHLRAIHNLSYDGVGRYLGWITHKWEKAIQPSELKLIVSEGLRFLPIWEGLGQQMKRGLQGGLLDGAQALIEAKALGISDGVAIYFACDYDAQPGEYPTISAYMDGVRKSLNGHYLDGLYAGAHVLDNVKASRKWEAVGWQYGEVSKSANMRQVQENVMVAGVKVDVSEIYSEIGWWPNMPTYPSVIAQLNGKSYPAVSINDETYPIWTLARDAGANLTKVAYGDVEIDDKKPRQVTDGENTYIHYADIVPVLTPHLLTGGGFNFTTPVHDYQLTVNEEDSEIAGRWASITIATLDDGKPLGHQLIKINENGALVCTDYTDSESGEYGYAVTETTNKVDTVVVVWQDPSGKIQTVTKTTKFTVPKVTPTPLPSDDSVIVQFPLLPTSDVSNAILFSAKSSSGQDLTWQLDTGAFELCLNAADAKTLNAPNLGAMTVEGVGGQSQGYYSQVTFVINGVAFKDVPCIVNPSFTLNSLFGYRFFVDNGYELLISQKHNTVTFCK